MTTNSVQNANFCNSCFHHDDESIRMQYTTQSNLLLHFSHMVKSLHGYEQLAQESSRVEKQNRPPFGSSVPLIYA